MVNALDPGLETDFEETRVQLHAPIHGNRVSIRLQSWTRMIHDVPHRVPAHESGLKQVYLSRAYRVLLLLSASSMYQDVAVVACTSHPVWVGWLHVRASAAAAAAAVGRISYDHPEPCPISVVDRFLGCAEAMTLATAACDGYCSPAYLAIARWQSS